MNRHHITHKMWWTTSYARNGHVRIYVRGRRAIDVPTAINPGGQRPIGRDATAWSVWHRRQHRDRCQYPGVPAFHRSGLRVQDAQQSRISHSKFMKPGVAKLLTRSASNVQLQQSNVSIHYRVKHSTKISNGGVISRSATHAKPRTNPDSAGRPA
jgi:hypothetical protein